VRIAYADPPYLGMHKKFYDRNEVNHPLLISYLETFDGWALSCSSPSLQTILPMCPADVRVGAWVKPFCSWKPGVNPAYAWEPVIFKTARENGTQARESRRTGDMVRDYVDANITLRRGFTGAKPVRFCTWIFDILGLELKDEFHDVFPGSGAVTKAYQGWREQRGVPLPLL